MAKKTTNEDGVDIMETDEAPAVVPAASADAALKARIAELEAQLAAQAAVSPAAPIVVYPKAKYRQAPVSDKCPNGYEARAVDSAEDEQRLGKEWKDSPAQL